MTYVAFDSSKERLAVAIATGGRRAEVRFRGTIPNRADAVRKLVERLAAKHPVLSFCYEAGPCGYGLHRQILSLGHSCMVVAPSLVPTRPGGHVKTDQRDAAMLATLFRAGELQGVWVPDADHEAMHGPARANSCCVTTAACRPVNTGPGRTAAGWPGRALLIRPSRLYSRS